MKEDRSGNEDGKVRSKNKEGVLEIRRRVHRTRGKIRGVSMDGVVATRREVETEEGRMEWEESGVRVRAPEDGEE